MSESMSGAAPEGSAQSGPGDAPTVLEVLDEAECLRLISAGGVGRIAFTGRYGPTVLPVNYQLHQGTIVFRTARTAPRTRTSAPG